jgi:hypothetical protein
MERLKTSIARWLCGLFLVAFSIPSALANTDYAYVFTANPGQVTWYNGTTIEIQVVPLSPGYAPPPDVGFLVVSLDFHGVLNLPAWAGDPPFFGPTPASMTPFTFSPSAMALNESFSEITSANASGWQGTFSGYGAGYTPIDQVAGYYVVSSYQMYWGSDGGGTGQAVTSEYATGTWSLVPDAGSSFELLAAALAALGAGRLAFGGWKNHGKS